MRIWTTSNLFEDPKDPVAPQEPPQIPPLPAAKARRGQRLQWISLSILAVIQTGLRERTLAAGVREKLSGWLGGRDHQATNTLLYRAQQHPELFPDLAHAIQELRLDFEEASGWLGLLTVTQHLLTCCQDGLAWANARVARRTGMILDQVLAGAEHPGLAPHLDHQARRDALRDAFALRAQGRADLIKRRRQSQEDRAADAQLTPEARAAYQSAARQRRSQRNRRAEGAADREQIINDLLERLQEDLKPR